jgi:hypothetical protein
VINFAVSEYALDVRNPFVGVYNDRTAGVLVRKPIPNDAIRKIQTECHQINDTMRWLIALISDTGLRLAEAAGLLKQDFIGLDTDQPYAHISRYPWRNLKTAVAHGWCHCVVRLYGLKKGSWRQIITQTLPSHVITKNHYCG